ncbi:MAG: DUF4136 domain-containing protein [Flavobacteriaceae bacterium]|nr:DUF4136 domain-containing protein [Flavobacteriaceae bacterium]
MSACGALVTTDYDLQTDFSEYNSYNFYPEIDSGLSDLDEKRIEKSIDSVLGLRGFQKSETPTFLINYFGEEQLNQSRNTIGIGVGSGGGNVGVGVSGGIPVGGYQIDQRLTIDFIDNEKDNLIWQAIVEAHYKEKSSPVQKDNFYFQILQKALKKFPPKKK